MVDNIFSSAKECQSVREEELAQTKFVVRSSMVDN